MTTLQYQLSRMTDRKKKLMTQASSRTDRSENTFCLSPKMDPASYSNAFNNYLIKLKDSEYKSKNPKMFIWKQKMQYMNKLNLPSQLLKPRNSSAYSSLRGGQYNDQSQDRIRSSKVLTRSPTRHLPRDFIKTEASTIESDGPIYTATPKMRRPQKNNLELDLNSLHSFYTTTQFQPKTTYPATRVQTELLSSRFSPKLEQSIPNFKYMLNHFDRKNLCLNKALSQMNTDTELLNREEIAQETLTKIAYVSKAHKLRRFLKPKINRPKLLTVKTEATRQSPFLKLNSINESANKTRSTPKHEFLITEPSSRRFNDSPPIISFANADEVKLKSTRFIRKERQNMINQRDRSFAEPDGSVRNKGDSRLRRFPDKEKEKSLVQTVENGLDYFEELSALREQASKENRQQHEKKKSLKQSISKDKTKEDEHIKMLTDEVGDDNIYFFGKYFKKRYMENGVRFDVSPHLQHRINALNHELKHSIRNVETIDFRDECG